MKKIVIILCMVMCCVSCKVKKQVVTDITVKTDSVSIQHKQKDSTETKVDVVVTTQNSTIHQVECTAELTEIVTERYDTLGRVVEKTTTTTKKNTTNSTIDNQLNNETILAKEEISVRDVEEKKDSIENNISYKKDENTEKKTTIVKGIFSTILAVIIIGLIVYLIYRIRKE